MNKDAQGRRKVERSESNWKCGTYVVSTCQSARARVRVSIEDPTGDEYRLKQQIPAKSDCRSPWVTCHGLDVLAHNQFN